MGQYNSEEDRGQSKRPPNPKVGARNQGGRQAAPSSRYQRQVNPPPVSRSRKDSIMRPVEPASDGTNANASGGQTQNIGDEQFGMPPEAPPALMGPPGADRGGKQTLHGRDLAGEQGLRLGTAGSERSGDSAQNFARGVPPPEAPPMPREQSGRDLLQAGMEPFQAGQDLQAPIAPPVPGEGPPGQAGGQRTQPPGAEALPHEPQPPDQMASTALDPQTGQPMAPPPAAPPQNDPGLRDEAQGQQAKAGLPQSPEGQADRMNAMADAPNSKSRMGEDQLGIKVEGSEQDASPNMWEGEIGPGKPANRGGALGMPGQVNSPEDVTYNRTRFDQALGQSKGDKAKASLSSGSFPSGNPIAHGTMSHMERLVDSIDGDGVDPSTLDEGTRRRYRQDAVRQMEEFGSYPGMDDPDSPPPPVRPLSYSYNPMTAKWTSPEGADSLVDRFGGSQ